MSMVNSTSELSIDFNEIGGAVYIKKNGVATESDISILDGKYVGEAAADNMIMTIGSYCTGSMHCCSHMHD